MFFIPFWIFFTVSVILAGATICLRKPRFIDIQIFIFVIAVSMSCDMLFCKHLNLYYYVYPPLRGWYSFWANLVAIPALGLIFIKFIPTRKERVILYIIAFSAAFTLIEVFILKPFGILYTHSWHSIPWSPIGFILALALEYIYYNNLEKRLK